MNNNNLEEKEQVSIQSKRANITGKDDVEENKNSLLEFLNKRTAESDLQIHAPLNKHIKAETATDAHPLQGNGDIGY
eukprot:9743015-Heterocapsa_arctica.AAC.1